MSVSPRISDPLHHYIYFYSSNWSSTHNKKKALVTLSPRIQKQTFFLQAYATQKAYLLKTLTVPSPPASLRPTRTLGTCCIHERNIYVCACLVEYNPGTITQLLITRTLL